MLIRLYEEANEEHDTSTINRCLDMFDKMFERRVGVVAELAQVIG
jgi:hypothetical protein